MATSKHSHQPLLRLVFGIRSASVFTTRLCSCSQTLLLLFLFSLATISESLSSLKAMAKDQIQCTMCTSCDNPCQPLYSPPPPPPPTHSPPPPYCPPPPSKPSSGTYFYPPPPSQQYYGPPPNGGGGGGGGYYPSPTNYFRTPPPNPIVPYFPYYYYSPPPAASRSYSIPLKNYPFISFGASFLFLFLFI